MRAYFWLFLGMLLISCESELSQDRIPEAPILDQNFLSNSLRALEKALVQNPSSSELHFQKASLLYQLDKPGSLDAINLALELNSEKPDYYFLKSLIHKTAGQDSQALENALESERLGETRVELFQLLAELYFRQTNYLETLNYSNQVIKVNPSDARPLLMKSMALLGLEDTIRAEYFLRKALDKDADNTEGNILAIRIFMARSEYDTASILLRRALALRPNDPELILQAGEWLRSDGLIDSAEGIWRKLGDNPGYQIRTWRLLADSKLERGQYDSASYYSEKILAHRSDDPMAHLTLARVADQQGNFALAIEEYQQILAQDSFRQIARYELDILNRKVAYLQKIRREFEQQKAQISTITPKKPDQ